MGYVFDFKDALAYDQWYNDPKNRILIDLENRLMIDLLRPSKGETLLDIGCGTGLSLQPFVELGISLTGIDPSPYMLDLTSKYLDHKVDLHRGYAEDLPFEDNSFTYAVLNTTLEFVDDPEGALQEACRVAKDKVFLGILNRYALKGIERRVKGIFCRTIYNHARFYSVWEVKHMLRSFLGDVPIKWRTICQLPRPHGKLAFRLEQIDLVQRCPFGAIAGMVITLVPRFKTTPLKLKIDPKHSPGAV